MAKITPIDIIKGVSGKFGGAKSKNYGFSPLLKAN